MLWCLWIGLHFAEPDTAMLTRAMAVGTRWRTEVIAPLRSARRALKAGIEGATDEALRAQVKEAELAAERAALMALDALTRHRAPPPPDSDGGARARRLLAAYGRRAGAAQTPGFSIALLEELVGLTVCCPIPGASRNPRDP